MLHYACSVDITYMSRSQARSLDWSSGLDFLNDPHADPSSKADEKPLSGGELHEVFVSQVHLFQVDSSLLSPRGSDMMILPTLLCAPSLHLLVNPSKENKGWCSSLCLLVITPINCHHTTCRQWNACRSLFTLQLLLCWDVSWGRRTVSREPVVQRCSWRSLMITKGSGILSDKNSC